MSEPSDNRIVSLKIGLRSVENFVFTQRFLCLVMNNPFNNIWKGGEKKNSVVFRVSFGAFLKSNLLDFCKFTTSSGQIQFDEEIANLRYWSW